MNIYRVCTSFVAIALASLVTLDASAAIPTRAPSARAPFRIGTHEASNGMDRSVAFTPCDPTATLVSENLDMTTITPGNSVNCFSGSGTPEHSYGRSYDLSLGATAGLPLELSCIHFGLALNSVAGNATVNVYVDLDGTPGPLPDGSDLWPLGSIQRPIPVTSTPIYLTADAVTPFPLDPDALIFIEIVMPATFPGTHEIGSNAAGETSLTWLKTTNGECGIGSWVNPSLLGFPTMHLLEAIEVSEAALPDPCNDPLTACAEDVDGDGIVAVSDILSIIGNWGNCGDGSFRPVGDVAPMPNGDCCVTVADILAVISAWGNDCNPPTPTIGINEIRTDQSGADNDEYFELIGEPGTILDGFSYIVIGDSTTAGSGVLECIVDLTGLTIGADGLLSVGKATMLIGIPDAVSATFNFENSDNVTHMLVSGLTALLNDDLDLTDDGVLDSAPWTEVLDAVGLVEVGFDGEILDSIYTTTVLGPVGIYPPSHVFRCPDGGAWQVGVYGNLAMDTPGDLNMCDVPDLDGDGVFDLVDNCYLANPDQADCNYNGTGDVCDLADGTSLDCNLNSIPDECEDDCDGNGIPDECDILNGAVDCDGNGILDICEADCNTNGVVDACDISSGTSIDTNGNGVPDECEVGILMYTSFEEPVIGAKYFDLGDALLDHQLVNNPGEADVEFVATGAEIGFTAWYFNTRNGVGLTDGDYVGVTDYTGGGVGAYPEGIQGYQFSDTDGKMLVEFDLATGLGEWNVSIDLFVAATGWEADDVIVVEVVVDGGVIVPLLNTTGLDINDLGIEGAWFTLLQDLTGYSVATLRVSLDSNSGSEAMFMDNIIFSANAILDSDGDGIPDAQDNCILPNPDQLDCNGNSIGDVCDLADGVSFDCNLNSIPDECEADCNTNGIPDECDIANGTSIDADGNGIPDECEVVSGFMVITGIVDGPLPGGLPKAIELYVISDIADLSIFGIGSANNGGGTDGQEFTFDAVPATAGQFIYVASEDVEFVNFFGFAPDYMNSAANNNGDDAVELFENGNVIDTFGDINLDGTSQPWEYTDGWASRLSMTGPDGVIFMLNSWTYSGINVLDGETSNATALTPFPLGVYIP